jgi:GTP pyrophosphokinase
MIESSLASVEEGERQLLERLHVPPDWLDDALPDAPFADNADVEQRVAAVLRRLPQEHVPVKLRRSDEPLDAHAFVVAASRQLIAFARSCPMPEESVSRGDEVAASRSDVLQVRHGFVPLLRALGMWEFKRALEDAAFRFDAASRHDVKSRAEQPDRYEVLARAFEEFKDLHSPFVDHVVAATYSRLRETGIDAQVEARFCGMAGARRRLLVLGGTQSFASRRPGDFFSLHLRTREVSECYAAVDAVHQVGLPSPASFTDLIAAPKPNGHSGLLTRLAVDWGTTETGWGLAEPLQALIQTGQMDDVARFGVLAPVCQDVVAGKVKGRAVVFAERLLSNVGLLTGATKDAFIDDATITVFSSGGRSLRHTPRTIERGATVLDLAYQVHSAVGDRAESARVNGKDVDLGYPLVEGDVVEILLADGDETVRREADSRLVTTRLGRRKVRSALNANAEMKGRHQVIRYLEREGLVFGSRDALDAAISAVAHHFPAVDLRTPEAIYRAVADDALKSMTGGAVGARIARLETIGASAPHLAPNTPMAEWRPALAPDAADAYDAAVHNFKMCKTCQPGPSNAIVGVMSVKRNVTVHRTTCRHTRTASLIPLQWERQGRTVRSALTLYCQDRPLLVHGICEVLYRRGCGLEQIQAEVGELGTATVTLHVYTGSPVALGDLMEVFRRHPSVRNVRLDSSSLPAEDRRSVASGDWPTLRAEFERNNRWHRENPGPVVLVEPSFDSDRRFGDITLPYNEQKPTYVAETFYGRAAEKQKLLDRTSQGSGSYILITGPRRIGKSSLAIRFADGLPPSQAPLIVRLDLRRDDSTSSDVILRRIASRLSSRVDEALDSNVDPELAIERVVAGCDRPVVLVLDEFGGPVTSYINGTLGTGLFDWMRRTLEREDEVLRRLSVVFVAPPNALDHVREPALAPYFDRTLTYAIGPLLHLDAIPMITTPFRQQGVSIENEIADEIARLAGGHPYFLIAFLRKLIEYLNQKRGKSEVTSADVARCSRRLYLDPTYFEPTLLEAAPEPDAIKTLHAFAQVADDDLLSVSTIAQMIGTDDDRPALVATLRRASHFGILRRHVTRDEKTAFSFRVPLFRRWLAEQDAEMLTIPRSCLLR